MTGKEIYELIHDKDHAYLNSPNDDDEQPEFILTLQQCYKLAEHLGCQNRYYSYTRCLAEGAINSYVYGSVIIKLREIDKNGKN